MHSVKKYNLTNPSTFTTYVLSLFCVRLLLSTCLICQEAIPQLLVGKVLDVDAAATSGVVVGLLLLLIWF